MRSMYGIARSKKGRAICGEKQKRNYMDSIDLAGLSGTLIHTDSSPGRLELCDNVFSPLQPGCKVEMARHGGEALGRLSVHLLYVGGLDLLQMCANVGCYIGQSITEQQLESEKQAVSRLKPRRKWGRCLCRTYETSVR